MDSVTFVVLAFVFLILNGYITYVAVLNGVKNGKKEEIREKQ